MRFRKNQAKQLMKMRGHVMDAAVPVAFALVLTLVAPLRTAFQFGADEGYELMKGFLVSLGHPLYREIWNDQPPLHTEILALLFRVFGPSAYVGRLSAVAFAALLVWTLYSLVSAQSDRIAGLLAVLLLMSSSVFLQLSVSVMLEVPAMALGLAAVWAWFRYDAGVGRVWLPLSGLLFGCALQVKLTAVIFAPALAVAYVVSRLRRKRQVPDVAAATPPCLRSVPWSPFRGRSWEPAIWTASVATAFSLVLLALYRLDTLSIFWASHFSPGTQNAVVPQGYGFRPLSLLDNPALSVSALAGLLVVTWKRRWDLLFPAVLLGTVLAIHLSHRPYWYYYGLHFAIPMAWLGAVGIVEWFRILWGQGLGASRFARLRLGFGLLGWSALLSLVLTLGSERAWNELRGLATAPLGEENPIVLALRQNAASTRWVFTDRVIYPFWAGLPVPPELAVIPSKRIWSGQITAREILECLERYHPEQVLLQADWGAEFGLSDYLQTHYRSSPSAGEGLLYLRADIGRQP